MHKVRRMTSAKCQSRESSKTATSSIMLEETAQDDQIDVGMARQECTSSSVALRHSGEPI